GHCGFREDCELLCTILHNLGEDATQRLIETLQTAPAGEAAETIGLLSQLSPESVEKILPVRLSQWPRSSHDRVIRQLSAAPPKQRAQLLVAIYDSLDTLIRTLAIDEMGMSGQAECIRSEEHTSELQSHLNLVCRLLLEKKNNTDISTRTAFIIYLFTL